MLPLKISGIWLRFEPCMGSNSEHRNMQEIKPQFSRAKKIIMLFSANRTAIKLQLIISDLDSSKCLG